uniref:BZIP domain-containing protein n=1 Tax=Globisporangium ultimum (strain ATCC 200006 / CBS 805.95 / DAOM BR144) TaxID=431595 RepID=K3X0D9_GLOUD
MQIHPTSSRAELASPVVADKELEMAKLDRKRSQDRLHQRRHRAKRKQQLSALEQDVKDLQMSVAQLGQKRQRLNNSFAGHCSPMSSVQSIEENKKSRVDDATKIVREYFQVFKYGHSAIHQDAQEQFLHRVLKPDVVGVDMRGVNAFVEQWRLSGSFFWSMLLEAKSMTARSSGDLTIVEVDADVHLRFRADLATVLCPQLVHHEELLKTIVDNVICVGAKYTFIVEQDGQVSGLLVEIEFINALCRVLGSLIKASQVIEGAQISMGSGTINCKLPVVPVEPCRQPKVKKTQKSPALNYRLQLNYLLSSSS